MALSKNEIINQLNGFLAHEYSAVITYMQQSFMLRGQDRETLQPKLYQFGVDEMSHIRQLAEKIVSLGGTPTIVPDPIVLKGYNAAEILAEGIKNEEEAIAKFGEFIDKLMTEGPRDYALRAMIEGLLLDEDRHLSELRLLSE